MLIFEKLKKGVRAENKVENAALSSFIFVVKTLSTVQFEEPYRH